MADTIKLSLADARKVYECCMFYAAPYAHRYREYDQEQTFRALGRLIANELHMASGGRA